LKLKGVPEKLIQKALYSLDDDDYMMTLQLLAEKKEQMLNEKDKIKRKFKLISYLQGRGFERDLIYEALKVD